MSNKQETQGATISTEDGKYVLVEFKKGVSIEEKHAIEITEMIANLIGSTSHGNVIDARNLLFLSTSARAHFAAQDSTNVKAVAIIVNSRIQSGFANLYMNFTKRVIETKVFSNLEEAKAWIDTKL